MTNEHGDTFCDDCTGACQGMCDGFIPAEENQVNMDYFSLEIRWCKEDKCYIARCPELSGVNLSGWIAHGDTWAETAMQARIAVSGILSTMREQGQPIPQAKVITLSELSHKQEGAAR